MASPSHPHGCFTFIIQVLVNLIQVKYQGQPESPFDTHPFTTFISIFSLLLYCFLALLDHLFVSLITLRPPCPCARVLIRSLMTLAASLSVASLASFLFRGSFCFLAYLVPFVLLSCLHLHGLIRQLHGWVRRQILLIFMDRLRSHRRHSRRLAQPPLPRTITNMQIMLT
ncbi:hypothetical protein BT93_D1791 [Corymbia citriodora subsp. variegata]|nr:hypothetical protein BT93_D1791 [Corymbia citriodora subsp. variegata]